MATKSRHLKTPTQLWIADNRKRLGLTPHDLAVLTGVTDDTARAWESRGKPSEDALRLLEQRFGQPRPSDATDLPSGDLATLIRAQTEAIDRQTAMLERVLTLLAGRQGATGDETEAAVAEALQRTPAATERGSDRLQVPA
jgi:transcriptional regulator with XRE-family HTH domain